MRLLILLTLLLSPGCSGSDATRVELGVRSSFAERSTNDLGYEISLTRVRLAMSDLHFTSAGEAHAGLLDRAANLLLATAHAHPGHAESGVVTGELAGPLLATFGPEATALGEATLLVAKYTGMNFTFRSATAEDGLLAGDPLLGHTAHLEGTAVREGKSLSFSAIVDVESGAKLAGAPADFEVSEGSKEVLTFGMRSAGAGGDGSATLFDLIDFAALDEEHDGRVELVAGSAPSKVLARSLRAHAFYELRVVAGAQ